MTSVEMNKQLVITVDNRVGTLADITHVLSTSGINLVAICAYAVDNKGVIMFVSENNARAKRLLKAKKYDVREEDVLLATVDNKPGALQTLTKKISQAGIDLTLVYGSVDKKCNATRLVIISEDNKAVLLTVKIKC